MASEKESSFFVTLQERKASVNRWVHKGVQGRGGVIKLASGRREKFPPDLIISQVLTGVLNGAAVIPRFVPDIVVRAIRDHFRIQPRTVTGAHLQSVLLPTYESFLTL